MSVEDIRLLKKLLSKLYGQGDFKTYNALYHLMLDKNIDKEV